MVTKGIALFSAQTRCMQSFWTQFVPRWIGIELITSRKRYNEWLYYGSPWPA